MVAEELIIAEDVIRAKGLGVALDSSIEDDQDLRPEPAPHVNLEARYYRARFESCRDGMWFSIAMNVVLFGWILWTAWRW